MLATRQNPTIGAPSARWHERLLKLERRTGATAPALLRMVNGW